MKLFTKFLSFAVTTALAVGTSIAFAQDDPIKFGFNSDISASPSALVGQAGLAGAMAAVEDINAAGGLLGGRQLSLVVRDDLGQPQTSIQHTIELISNEGVVALVGGVNSGNVMAWKNIANENQVPALISMATATNVTSYDGPGENNYMFRISLVDRENVFGLLSYVGKNPKSEKVGFLAETTGYGLGALEDLKTYASDYGVEPVLIETFGVGDTDMTSQLNKMRSAGVDTIIIWGQTTPLAQVYRSMEKLDYFPLTLTCWVSDQAPFAEAVGPTLREKPIFMRTRAGGEMSPAMAELFERIKAKTTLGEPPIAQASQSYDAIMLLAKAIEQAGSTDGPAIKQALENLEQPHEGLMKTYDKPFSSSAREGLGAGDYHWVHWQGNQVVPYADEITEALAAAD